MTTRDRILLSLLLYQGKTSYQKVYSFLPPEYDQPNFYSILRRMEADQLIKRSNTRQKLADSHLGGQASGNTQLLRLGPDALSFLESRFGPRIRSLLVIPSVNIPIARGSLDSSSPTPQNDKEKSKTFSLVIYDFPLSLAYHRARLQTKLEQFGMGMLRKGVYISPYDVLKSVAAWAEENRVLDHVYLLRPGLAWQGRAFPSTADHIWPLSQISHLYLSLLDRLAIVKGQQIPEKRVSGLRRIKSDFLEFVSRDPLLPKTLIPSNWPFARVTEALIGIN